MVLKTQHSAKTFHQQACTLIYKVTGDHSYEPAQFESALGFHNHVGRLWLFKAALGYYKISKILNLFLTGHGECFNFSTSLKQMVFLKLLRE